MDNTTLIEKLSEYGTVRTCKQVHDDVVTVVITEGFSENLMTGMAAMKLITDAFPDHPILETYVTEKDLCIVVLKRKKDE